MPDETENLLRELLGEIRNNPEAIKKLQKAVLHPTDLDAPKPPRYTEMHRVPYYKEYYAKMLLPVLNELLAREAANNINDVELRAEDFPGISRKTLLNRVNQSWLFISDLLDPDKKYTNLRARVEVQLRKTGVRFHFLAKIPEGSMMKLTNVAEDNLAEVRAQIDAFVESAEVGQELRIKDISLTEESVNMLQQSFISIENLFVDITGTRVLIRRLM